MTQEHPWTRYVAIGDSFTEGIGDPEPKSPGGFRRADRHDLVVADMWALRELKDSRMWAPDRLHFSPIGHNMVARMVLDALDVENSLEPHDPVNLCRRVPGAERGPRISAGRVNISCRGSLGASVTSSPETE